MSRVLTIYLGVCHKELRGATNRMGRWTIMETVFYALGMYLLNRHGITPNFRIRRDRG
jgi:hypothetical protein